MPLRIEITDQDIAEIETVIDQVIAGVLRDGVTQAEIDRAKVGMLANAVYGRDSLFNAARVFGTALTAGLTIAEIEAWPDLVQAVTVEQVNEAARYVLDIRRSVTGLLLPKAPS